MRARLFDYFDELGRLIRRAEASDRDGRPLDIGAVVQWAIDTARATAERGNTLLFIGNGGSAAMCSHMAADYGKNGGMRALAFNDGAMLTCLGNDLGYENVFARQLELHARPGDLLVAISSSGRSPNILNGVEAARRRGAAVMTLSGFRPDNPLRALGDVNVYVPSTSYGVVEITHEAICHCILDTAMAEVASSAA